MHSSILLFAFPGGELQIILCPAEDTPIDEVLATIQPFSPSLGPVCPAKVPATPPLTRKQFQDSLQYWTVNFHEDKTLVPELQIRCVKLTSINSTCVISQPNPMFNHLLEWSRWDDSNKWSNIGFGEEIGIIEIKICTLSGALQYMYSMYYNQDVCQPLT